MNRPFQHQSMVCPCYMQAKLEAAEGRIVELERSAIATGAGAKAMRELLTAAERSAAAAEAAASTGAQREAALISQLSTVQVTSYAYHYAT
jgi:hypothetical protein